MQASCAELVNGFIETRLMGGACSCLITYACEQGRYIRQAKCRAQWLDFAWPASGVLSANLLLANCQVPALRIKLFGFIDWRNGNCIFLYVCLRVRYAFLRFSTGPDELLAHRPYRSGAGIKLSRLSE